MYVCLHIVLRSKNLNIVIELNQTMSSKQMFYRIQQLRSTIGMPPQVRKNIAALGLKKRNHIVYQQVSPAAAHRLRLVKELVSIDLLDADAVEQQKLLDKQKFPKGFEKVGEL